MSTPSAPVAPAVLENRVAEVEKQLAVSSDTAIVTWMVIGGSSKGGTQSSNLQTYAAWNAGDDSMGRPSFLQ